MSIDVSELPDRINLGCGWDKRVGYLNVDLQDFHEPDLVADITHLDELPTGHFTEVVAQDVLEHLARDKAPTALREWARITALGGTLILRVPNLLGLAYLLTTRTEIPDQRDLIQCAFGTQAYTGDFHLNGYTELLLRHDLAEAGFGDAVFTVRDEWLFDVVATRQLDPRLPTIADCRFMAAGQPSELAASRSVAPATIVDAGLRRLRRLRGQSR